MYIGLYNAHVDYPHSINNVWENNMKKFFSKKETETLVNPLNEYDSIEVMIYRHGDYRLEKELYGENRRLYFIYKNENGKDRILIDRHREPVRSYTLKRGQSYIENISSGVWFEHDPDWNFVSVDDDNIFPRSNRLNWKTLEGVCDAWASVGLNYIGDESDE